MSQPAFQADAGDLANARNATVYTGDPILTAEDTDGDGVVERRSWDVDADGDADIVAEVDSYSGREFVTHQDAYTRAGYVTAKDDDQDGRIDTLMRDTDGDGHWDRFDHDVDGDGVADRYGYDIADGVDPEPARWVGAQPEARDDQWVADAVADPTDAGRPVPAQDAAIPEYVPDPVYAPAVEASALDLPVTADPRYGSGADSDADGREADYEQETVNTFADTLQDTPSPERLDAMAAPDGYGSGANAETDAREMDYEQETVNTFADTLQDTPSPERLDAMADPSPYEAPVGADHVDDAAASPVFAPVAEASQADDARADLDDDYVG